MNGRFQGKHIVISGGATGAGAAACRAFRAEGATLSMLDINTTDGDALARELGSDFYHIDISVEDQVCRAVEAVLKKHSHVDVLYNHAGTLFVRSFLETSTTDWQRLMAVNVMSMVYTMRATIPHMMAAGGGAIVNMASISGLTASALESAYCTTKAACIQLTRAIAVEFRDRNVRCNALAPGFIRTPHGLNELGAFAAAGAPFTAADMHTLQGRMAEPEEIAAVVLFLASDEARFINGETVVVDNAAMART